MSTLEKLQQAASLLESAFYDLEFDVNSRIESRRALSVAEDLVADVINDVKRGEA